MAKTTVRHNGLGWLLGALVVASLSACCPNLGHSGETIRIAGGTPGGQYHRLAELLGRHMQSASGRPVDIVETAGSVENQRLLEQGEVQLAILQLGPAGLRAQSLLTPLYREAVHVLVRADGTPPMTLADLHGKRVLVGESGSGMREIAFELLAHAGLGVDDFVPVEAYFAALRNDPTLDAAVVTSGVLNPDLASLMRGGRFRLLDIESADGLALTQPFYSSYTLPQGLYHSGNPPIPRNPVQTVSTMAVLAAKPDISASLVELSLDSLYESDVAFEVPVLLDKFSAYQWAEYPKNKHAVAYFNPYEGIDSLAALMESVAAAKELIVAFFAALFFAWKLLQRGKLRKFEKRLARDKDRLDVFLNRVIEIERRQIDEASPDTLHTLLGDVTAIKLEALEELTNEQLRADSAFEIFLAQCAHLSRKIQNKLLLLEGRAGTSEPD